jgi:Zn finger protein HypA/HybF involved in hydrogenase expression
MTTIIDRGLLDRAIEAFDLQAYCIEHGGNEVQAGPWVLICPTCGKPKLAVHLGQGVALLEM